MTPPAENPATESPRLTGREWGWVLAAGVLGTLVKLVLATRRGFWLDEYYTLHAALMPVRELVAERLAAGHSPLPFLYAKFFLEIFGSSEQALKLSSIVAAFAAFIGTAGLTAQLGLKRLLPVLVPLLVVHPYWHRAGTEFRYMMPLIAMGAFWTWSALAYQQEPTRRGFLVVTLLGAVTLWLHSSAIFILFALLLFYAWSAKGEGLFAGARLPLVRLFAPLLAALLIMLPLTVTLGKLPKEPGRAETPDLFKAINKQSESFFSDPGAAESWVGVKGGAIQVPGTILFVGCVWAAAVRLGRERKPAARRALLSLLGGIPVAAMVYTAVANSVQGPVRYVAFSSVPVVIVLALGLAEATRWRVAGRLFQGALGAIILYCYTLQLIDQGDWHRESVKWLAGHRRTDQPVLAIGRAMNLLAFRYLGMDQEGYFDGLNAEVRSKGAMRKLIGRGLERGESCFLFHYRGQRRYDEINESIEKLQKQGLIVYTRTWEPSEEIRIIGIARSEAGAEALKSLPEMPKPRFSSSQL